MHPREELTTKAQRTRRPRIIHPPVTRGSAVFFVSFVPSVNPSLFYPFASSSRTRLEQFLGRADAVGFRQLAAFVLDADEAVVAGVHHDLQHLVVVGVGLVALVVEVVRLGADALGVAASSRPRPCSGRRSPCRAEVAEVRQRAAALG